MVIRPFLPDDLDALWRINETGRPGVGGATPERLGSIIDAGSCDVAVDEDDEPIGFVLLHRPGAAYDSPNFAWFEQHRPDVAYVDRIAVAAPAGGRGLGAALYEAVFERWSGEVTAIGCEVNTDPPNPASLRFHHRLGFEVVGEQRFADDYAVVYLARPLEA